MAKTFNIEWSHARSVFSAQIERMQKERKALHEGVREEMTYPAPTPSGSLPVL